MSVSNTERVVLASAARTAAATSDKQDNPEAKGIIATLNVTVAVAGTGGLTLRVRGYDPATGTAYNLNGAPTAVTATGLTVYVIYPAATAMSGATQSTIGVLPRQWDVTVAVGDSTSYTYSVGCVLLTG